MWTILRKMSVWTWWGGGCHSTLKYLFSRKHKIQYITAKFIYSVISVMLSHIIFQNKAVKSKNKFSSQILCLLASFKTNFALLQTVFLSMIIAFQKNPGQDCIQNKNSPLLLLPFPPLGITQMLVKHYSLPCWDVAVSCLWSELCSDRLFVNWMVFYCRCHAVQMYMFLVVLYHIWKHSMW